jgi:hypothetical protein
LCDIKLCVASIFARYSHDGLTLHPYLLDEEVEAEESTIADGFVEVLARLKLEYDLPPDVWSVAEDVLQALKTRNTDWTPRERFRN